MQRLVYLGGLILLIICTGQALALDCQSGADYYYRAKTETDQQMMIHWLNRSVKACPNYNAWYMLGLIYADQDKTKPALTAFEQARTTAGSARTGPPPAGPTRGRKSRSR